MEAPKLGSCKVGRYGQLLPYINGFQLASRLVVNGDQGAGVDACILHIAVKTFQVDGQALIHGIAGSDHGKHTALVFGIGQEFKLHAESDGRRAYGECGDDVFSFNGATVLEFRGASCEQSSIG
ncbi:hypothetical protein IAQ61_007651 [Plenodomus lingam]|uniref:uncharacterized protein n=1 Tax=Leptosphaeria maculans TaxID=5022 RepID=UPI0033237B11|nr:hypothetical protein IAQ61_007651 [Plenodomus lingam]